ncbi:hypothetical protein ABBQ32_012037 [Trebouxia sp. C0010 RCD-2024]
MPQQLPYSASASRSSPAHLKPVNYLHHPQTPLPSLANFTSSCHYYSGSCVACPCSGFQIPAIPLMSAPALLNQLGFHRAQAAETSGVMSNMPLLSARLAGSDASPPGHACPHQ